MNITFVLYQDFTALDLVGPYEVLARWPDAHVQFIASDLDPVRADVGLTVLPSHSINTLDSADVIVVPGSGNPMPVLQAKPLLEWVRQASEQARWMVSICTGASIYAAAGLLEGRRATTHWAFRDVLAQMGATVVDERVVYDENYVSGAGVSAGIDVALDLTARVHGDATAQAIQLVIEYDPRPPFDAGAPEKAGASVKDQALTILLQTVAARDAEQPAMRA